jgi:hypothetical protein
MRRKAKLIVTGMMLVCTSVVLAYSSAKPQPVRTFRTKKAPAPVQPPAQAFSNAQSRAVVSRPALDTPPTARAIPVRDADGRESFKVLSRSGAALREARHGQFRVVSETEAASVTQPTRSGSGAQPLARAGAGGRACGDPESGDCCEPNGTPYCDDATCCESVCSYDAWCCGDEGGDWDDICAEEAWADPNCGCEACGDPESGDCCEPNGTPYCDDAACCESVCSYDAWCCGDEGGEWDDICAAEASEDPNCNCGGGGGCGAPGTGDCCVANWTPYCEDAECCELICYEFGMFWCCDEEEGGWDEECVQMAQDVCDCPPPTAACCLGEECITYTREECEALNGEWYRDHQCLDAGGDLECPGCPAEGSLFSQNVTSYFPGYSGSLSDLDAGGRSYERFWDVNGDICGLRWVGVGYDQDFWGCIENPMTFDIRFHEDDGGMPGAEVCAYTVEVEGRPVIDLWMEVWFEYTVELDTCCTLNSGHVSIAGTGDPECLFGWISSDEGDGTRCTYWEGEWDCPPPGTPWAFDYNICLLGTLYPGACCDEVAGTCQDGVEAVDCPSTRRFAPGVLCADMDPPCGDLAGACCVEEAPYCHIEAEVLCEGIYLGHGTTCDPNDCNTNGVPDTCDIASGFSLDCNENDVPDECDIAGGTSDDYDGNGVPDECDPDCNTNGVVDACDVSCATGTCAGHPGGCGGSLDCQPDGIPDECQLGGGGSSVIWDNGLPNDERLLRSQYGGSFPDAMTVDDISLPEGGIINDLHWYNEEQDFTWTGRVRVEVYADNGANGPDESGGPTAAIWVPDDGGIVTRTLVGPGAPDPSYTRYHWDVSGISILLDPGIWWIGIAPGGEGNSGHAKWCSSRSGADVVMGEVHLRAPSYGIPSFEPWSQYLSSPAIAYDVSFTVTALSGADCNSNGIPDDCDIMYCDGSPWCLDCQPNGIPDGCEEDCNDNDIADQCDIRDCDGSPWCDDCNDNRILDECEVPPIGGPDCNDNLIPDDCDIAEGTSQDCNENDIPDECDIAGGASDDYDLNGVPDECDPDCNANGVPDACDLDCGTGNCASHPGGCGGSIDCQPDGIPDECQLTVESTYQVDDGTHENSTGLSDGGTLGWMDWYVVEGGVDTITAISLAWGNVANGKPCMVYLWNDPDGDGDPTDAKVLASAATVVANADTDIFTTVDIPDTYVGPDGTIFFVGAIMDHDDGEYPASADYDADTHGWIVGDTSYSLDPNDLGSGDFPPEPYSPWLVRGIAFGDNDCNGNDVPDECDIADGTSEDCDANGMPDECEWLDCNDNGVHDPCDLLDCDGSPWCSDCNTNGIPDDCDIAEGTSDDCQPDGTPDECQLGAPILVLDETFYTDAPPWEEEPLPNGWESVTVAGEPWNQWIVTGSWGADYQGGAVVWGNVGKGEEGRDPLDIYMLSPVLTGTDGVLRMKSMGCGADSEPWCDNMALDVLIVIGDIGGGDDIFVSCLSDVWTGYFSAFYQHEFDLAGLLTGDPFRIGFRYYGDGMEFDSTMVDQVTLTRMQPGSDCNENAIPDFCDLRDCDGSAWCDDCNEDEVLDGCQLGDAGGHTYQWDDGTVETAFGYGITADHAWIQRFDAQAGSETIEAIATTFGRPEGDAGVAPGDPFRVYVWSDPEGFGELSDAVLLAEASATADAAAINTGALQTVPIGPVTVEGSFFIGASVVSELHPGPGDRDEPLAHESWMAFVEGGTFDPNDLMSGEVELVNMDWWNPTDWVLRALTSTHAPDNDCNENGVPDECDEPTCGNNCLEGGVGYSAEECDGDLDDACPGECYPPGHAHECECPFCGDGVVGDEEECDDGNANNGDGCSADCIIEFCGDGIVQPLLGEQCDDGNNEPGDNCDENCQIELPEAIPTVSGWGLAILALLLLTGAKVYFSRRARTA